VPVPRQQCFASRLDEGILGFSIHDPSAKLGHAGGQLANQYGHRALSHTSWIVRTGPGGVHRLRLLVIHQIRGKTVICDLRMCARIRSPGRTRIAKAVGQNTGTIGAAPSSNNSCVPLRCQVHMPTHALAWWAPSIIRQINARFNIPRQQLRDGGRGKTRSHDYRRQKPSAVGNDRRMVQGDPTQGGSTGSKAFQLRALRERARVPEEQ